MKKFVQDATEFFCFELEGSDEIHKIPLAGSMQNRDIKAFEATNGNYSAQVEWLRGIIGDVVDDLTIKTTKDIILSWMECSQDQGATVGES